MTSEDKLLRQGRLFCVYEFPSEVGVRDAREERSIYICVVHIGTLFSVTKGREMHRQSLIIGK